MDIEKYDEEDKIIFTDIYNEIKLIADKKIVELHNHQIKNIDIKSIYIESQNEYIGNFFKEIEALLSFDNHLLSKNAKIDDPIVSEKFFHKMAQHGESITNCKTWHELKVAAQNLVISQEEKESLNATGIRLFQEGDYFLALANFTTLCAIDFNNAENWLRKGMAEQNFTSPRRALKCYSLAIYFDATLILTYIQVIECLILIHALDEAKQAFDTFVSEIDYESYKDNELVITKLNNIKEFINNPVY